MAALARSARASRRLNLASWMTPASASLEKLPVHSTKVLFSCSPEVTAKQRMVLTTLVYESSELAVMTLYVM